MSTQSTALTYLLVLLISLTIAPNVQAQTTTIIAKEIITPIEGLVLQNGVAQATVDYLVAFSDLPSDYYLFFGVLYAGTSTFVKGSGTSDDGCYPIADTAYANSAVCATVPSSNSGDERVLFNLTFNSIQQSTLEAFAAMANKSSHAELSGSITTWLFTISVTAQTVPSTTTLTSTTSELTSTSTSMIILGLSVIALIGIIGLILFVVRRRKGKRTGGKS